MFGRWLEWKGREWEKRERKEERGGNGGELLPPIKRGALFWIALPSYGLALFIYIYARILLVVMESQVYGTRWPFIGQPALAVLNGGGECGVCVSGVRETLAILESGYFISISVLQQHQLCIYCPLPIAQCCMGVDANPPIGVFVIPLF